MQHLKSEAPADQYDVMIVGAGLVGASAALGLASMGQRVLLIDVADVSVSGQAASSSFDDRATALSYGSREILEALGVWSELQAFATPIHDIHVSEQGRLGVTRMHAKDYHLDALGYVAPNKALGKVLFSALTNASLDYLAPATVQALKAVPGGQQITLEAQRTDGPARYEVKVGLLLIADGARSKTAGLAGIDYALESYRQAAVIANVETYAPHGHWAYERFTAKGPMALLPLDHESASYSRTDQCRFALVWTLPEDEVDAVMDMDDEQVLGRLERAFGGRMGGIVRIGKRSHYPLSLIRAKEQFRPGILLLGNAAHSLHPVAGQGFNLALRGLASALSEIRNGLVGGYSIGDMRVLSAAVKSHAFDRDLTIHASDQLVKQFGESSIFKGLFRELGLVGLNNIPAAKRLFVEQAMGVAGKAQASGGWNV